MKPLSYHLTIIRLLTTQRIHIAAIITPVHSNVAAVVEIHRPTDLDVILCVQLIEASLDLRTRHALRIVCCRVAPEDRRAALHAEQSAEQPTGDGFAEDTQCNVEGVLGSKLFVTCQQCVPIRCCGAMETTRSQLTV